MSRADGTSIASPGSRNARCMSTTSSAVLPGSSFSASSNASARSIRWWSAQRSTQPSARLRLRLELPRRHGKRVRDVADRLDPALVVDHDRHDVEAAGLLAQALGPEIALRELAQLVLLARVHAGLRRRRILDVPARLHLDEDEGLALLGDEIDLAHARADVLFEDGVPAACQKAGSLLFTLDACDLPRVDRHGSLLARYDREQVLL